jgi:ribonuclease T1
VARFPFPRFPGPARPRRRYPRRVGLIGALALLIAAVAGGMQQCNAPTGGQPPAASSQQPAAKAPNDLSGRVTAPAAPPAQWQVLDGQPITEPAEVRGIWDTLRRVAAGPPYPYRQDGESFSNREGRLPKRERGWWREFTVETPGSSDRGARRLVVGRDGEAWYTADHYRSFARLLLP